MDEKGAGYVLVRLALLDIRENEKVNKHEVVIENFEKLRPELRYEMFRCIGGALIRMWRENKEAEEKKKGIISWLKWKLF